MQEDARYRQFADVLALAADEASPATRRLLLNAAEAWREMAAPVEDQAGGEVVFVDFRRRASVSEPA